MRIEIEKKIRPMEISKISKWQARIHTDVVYNL